MKFRTILIYLLLSSLTSVLCKGQSPIDTLTQVNTTINAGAFSVVDTLNNRSYSYTIGQISGPALALPDQSYEIGFVHCIPCAIASSILPDLSALIKVYPKPSKDILRIESEYSEMLSYEIVSSSGQMLISGSVRREESIEISHLPEGLYLLIFYQESGKAIWFDKISKI